MTSSKPSNQIFDQLDKIVFNEKNIDSEEENKVEVDNLNTIKKNNLADEINIDKDDNNCSYLFLEECIKFKKKRSNILHSIEPINVNINAQKNPDFEKDYKEHVPSVKTQNVINEGMKNDSNNCEYLQPLKNEKNENEDLKCTKNRIKNEKDEEFLQDIMYNNYNSNKIFSQNSDCGNSNPYSNVNKTNQNNSYNFYNNLNDNNFSSGKINEENFGQSNPNRKTL